MNTLDNVPHFPCTFCNDSGEACDKCMTVVEPVKVSQITADSNPALWALLQPPK